MERRDIVARLEEEAARIAAAHDGLANPARVLILAALMALGGEASWSDLKKALELVYGEVNPNFLAFHLRRLISSGIVGKAALEEPRYVLEDEGLAKEVKPLAEMFRSLLEVRSAEHP